MRQGVRLLVLNVLVLLLCWGCGSSEGPFAGATVPVQGKVTFRGKPLSQGQIVFEPDSAGREAHGSINSDGTFELTTYKQGDGAVPGTHRVAVTGTSQKDRIPAKYQSIGSSKTEIEVAEGKTEYSIDLK